MVLAEIPVQWERSEPKIEKVAVGNSSERVREPIKAAPPYEMGIMRLNRG